MMVNGASQPGLGRFSSFGGRKAACQMQETSKDVLQPKLQQGAIMVQGCATFQVRGASVAHTTG